MIKRIALKKDIKIVIHLFSWHKKITKNKILALSKFRNLIKYHFFCFSSFFFFKIHYNEYKVNKFSKAFKQCKSKQD